MPFFLCIDINLTTLNFPYLFPNLKSKGILIQHQLYRGLHNYKSLHNNMPENESANNSESREE
jgi:hypothetical protein